MQPPMHSIFGWRYWAYVGYNENCRTGATKAINQQYLREEFELEDYDMMEAVRFMPAGSCTECVHLVDRDPSDWGGTEWRAALDANC